MAWYDEAIFYHIYPLGMLGAPKQNAYGPVEHRLRELFPWIKHIKETGCTAIYIGPLFESVGHGYETTDYKKLDSRLGDNQDLKDFVAECHKEGMHVIFDGVFNHTGRDFFAFKDIQQYRENSRYRDWYCNVNFWGNNSYNDGFSYDNWGGYDLLVKLNQRNPEVRDYIADVIRFWVSEFDVDGIRLDAADVLDFDFMRMLRWVANEVKPEFWLMGEVIHGEYSRWANEGTLHSVTNYHLHKALFSGCNDKNFFEIAHTVKRLYGMGGNRPDGLKLYNFADNHDVERIYTKLNNKGNFFPVHILLYTLPGIPSIYYGSEFGIEGHKYRGGSDDEIRPCLHLEDFKDAHEKNDMTKLISALGRVRQENPALSYGDYHEAALTTTKYTYTRTLNGTTIIITVSNEDQDSWVEAWNLPDGEYVGALFGEKIRVEGGHLNVHLYANSGEIWIPAGYSKEEAAFDFRELERKAAEEKAAKEAAEKAEREAAEKAERERLAAIEAAAREAAEKAAAKAAAEAAASGLDAEAAAKAAEEAQAKAREEAEKASAPMTMEMMANRTDYDNMSIEELQLAILGKMAKNGPLNDQMKRSVAENTHRGSLLNWVKSFR